MKMPKSVAETTCDCYPDHIGAIYAEALLPVDTKLYDKQALIDLLEAAAVECETQCRNIAEKLYGKDLAVTIRSMKETL